ncbi:MAG: hypothetical protein LBP76_10240 [Treponema sp.]|jgi:hypothetical protein|nr:hypothetical protein [Treponema sp.]
MAGILDEVMGGIAEKEKQAAPGAGQAAAEPGASGEQTAPPKAGEKGMHEYDEAFKAKYGERKKGA